MQIENVWRVKMDKDYCHISPRYYYYLDVALNEQESVAIKTCEETYYQILGLQSCYDFFPFQSYYDKYNKPTGPKLVEEEQ